ncbi:type 1 glutamine amidotransferase domain-containing protein [Pectinatus haikarae]|uniref:Intracellular protease/amidase n=1 Tax=Pectinatus haikarae TaxID=349096 RepID=A0ABT9Y577_9FIRM|nr:type 1 glutamine amidotransferase domain-containing protein [Pectinatus haikarae]MDQ0202983.1 putative intracellular protease/amidase [Pectinatus haikarae]
MKKLAVILFLMAFCGISAASVSAAGINSKTKKVLMVVTNRDHFDNGRKTGIWMEEYAVPYTNFLAAGYEVTVASPNGGKAPIDPGSIKDGIPAEWAGANEALQTTAVLSHVNYKTYDAVVIPGGHGPLFDLVKDQDLAKILTYFNENNRIIAAVCHGTAALVSAKMPGGNVPNVPLVYGRKLTGFTNDEEVIAGSDKMVPFAVETKLKELGAEFSKKKPWSDYIVVDKNLITGQNPQSSKSLAQAVVAALNK